MRTRFMVVSLLAAMLGWAPTASAQAPPAPARQDGLLAGWEFTLDGRIGAPSGTLQVTEKPVGGTTLHLRQDLGVNFSGAVLAGLAYHITPSDALRVSYLHYFLGGSSTLDRGFAYNGQLYDPGRVDTTLDLSWIDLAYERVFAAVPGGFRLTGTAGLRYVSLDAVVNRNHEDFYRQELPVPILGLRMLYPLGARLGMTADVAGGGLPRVDSLRKEGGTVYVQQSHADAGIGVTYALTPIMSVAAGYHFTHFSQSEVSHEDGNRFTLFDHSLQLGLNLGF